MSGVNMHICDLAVGYLTNADDKCMCMYSSKGFFGVTILLLSHRPLLALVLCLVSVAC